MPLELHEVVRRPIISEKSMSESAKSVYCFEVDARASKPEIKRAVEKMFNVKVADVRTMAYSGKIRRVRATYKKYPDWKKAMVKLAEGSRIDLI